MRTFLNKPRRPRWRIAGLFATLLAVGAHGAPTCPDMVVSPAGSTFNVAGLIADSGSPPAALNTARAALSKVNSGGGCRVVEDIAACDETLVVAKQAIAALETCTAPTPPKQLAQKKWKNALPPK